MDQAVVGEVFQRHRFAVLSNGNALSMEHRLLSVIVGLTGKLPFALLRGKPSSDLQLQKALVCHATLETGGHSAAICIS